MPLFPPTKTAEKLMTALVKMNMFAVHVTVRHQCHKNRFDMFI